MFRMAVQARRNVQKKYIALIRAEYVSVIFSLLVVEITKIFMKAVERTKKIDNQRQCLVCNLFFRFGWYIN